MFYVKSDACITISTLFDVQTRLTPQMVAIIVFSTRIAICVMSVHVNK